MKMRKTNKKGLEMATGTIIAVVLGLIILVILIVFVQQQVTKGGKKFETLGAETNISADKCQSIIKGTFCAANCDSAAGYEEKKSPTGTWSDCGNNKCCGPK